VAVDVVFLVVIGCATGGASTEQGADEVDHAASFCILNLSRKAALSRLKSG
jgi:hypothetical protein